MRFLLMLAVVVVIGLFVWGWVTAARRTLVEAGPALWEADVEAGEGQTRVVVRRGAGRRTQDRIVVAEIPDGAADWQERLLLAQQEAESRAAVLNSG